MPSTASPYDVPPDSLLWRNAAEWSIPPTEGSRDLLVWQGFTLRIYTPNEPASGAGSWGWNYCGVCGPRGVLLPGDRPASLRWTWADGDPWTRRSPADRENEKLIFHAKSWGALPEIIQGILDERGHEQLGLPLSLR